MPSHGKRRESSHGAHRRRRHHVLGRWAKPSLWIALSIVLVATGAYALSTIDFSFAKSSAARRSYSQGNDAVWLAHTWVGDAHGDAEVAALVDPLAERGFRYLYVHSGPIEADGTVPGDRFRYARSFLATAKSRQPGLTMLAWLGGLNRADGEGDLDLTDSEVRKRIVATAQSFVHQGGWDGVHMDIEPMPTGRLDFLALLEELRAGLGSTPLISVAGQRLWVLPLPIARLPKIADFAWDDAYLRQVADRVNQVAVMTYDSSMPQRNLYIRYQREETASLIQALAYHGRVELLVGVPTYSDRRPNFNAEVENVSTGLQGVIEALDSTPDRKPFVGVSLYAHWTTSDDEWRTYERMWLGRNS